MFTRGYMTILWPSQHASGSISTCCVSQVQTLRRRLGRSTSSRVNGPWSRGNGTEVVLSDTYPTYPCQSMSIVLFIYIYMYVCIFICVYICPYYLSSFFLSIPILSTLKILNLESIFENLVHHGSSFCCSCSKVPATKAKAAPGAAPENERWVMISDDNY